MNDPTKTLQNTFIHWITSDRFDTKPDKTSWTEVGDSLAHQGAKVNIVASYKKTPYFPENLKVNMVYIKTMDLPLVYRLGFTLSAFIWLIKNANKKDLIILNPHELWMKPLLAVCGYKNIHLDIRTLPILKKSLKSRLDVFLYWRLVMRLFGQSCNSYSFITQRLLQAVEEEFSYNYRDYVIWQSGVNSDFFLESTKGCRSTGETSLITFFYHGSLYKRRGVDLLVNAYAELPTGIRNKSRFVIVGAGEGFDELQDQVAALELQEKIELRGFVPYEQIPMHIAEADICICPLPDYPEWNVSSPLKVLEYMASGKPMILTPIPAHKDVLDGEPFVVWSKGDKVGDLRDALVQAQEQLEALRVAGEKGRSLVREAWDWKAHGKRFGAYLAVRH